MLVANAISLFLMHGYLGQLGTRLLPHVCQPSMSFPCFSSSPRTGRTEPENIRPIPCAHLKPSCINLSIISTTKNFLWKI